MEIRNHRGHPAEVVGMRMRDHDHVEMIDASIPKIRRDHLFAEIEVRMHPLRQASSINEQGAALGRDQQNGIALSDVNGRHLHHAGAKMRARGDKRNPDGNAEQQHHGSESGQARATDLRRQHGERQRGDRRQDHRERGHGHAQVGDRCARQTWAPPSQCTVPAIPSSARPEIQTAGLASVVEMYPRPTAAAAVGISTWVSGITARLAGIPMVVAR